MSQDVRDRWGVPEVVRAFTVNLEGKAGKGRVQSWGPFRQTLFEIYEQRVKHAPEILGGVSPGYLSMDEFLVLFFIQQEKQRRPAETKLLEFVAALKYYV